MLLMFIFLSACGVYDEENKKEVVSEVNQTEYTKESYLVETSNDVREIRSLHDKLIVKLAEGNNPSEVSLILLDMSISATDQSYKLPGTESFEFDTIKNDLKEIQLYVDEKYNTFSEQKELDRISLNLTITQLGNLIQKLEDDFKSVYK